jgi:malate dehydrogenase (oxaloacetate-decarboxylating)
MCKKTNHEQRSGDIQEMLEGMDIVIAFSTPGPGVIKPEWIKRMSSRPVVFAAANPTPEIWPWEAKEAGAYVVATGRSDFPNQINNSLGFPAIFRGVLDVGASSISNDMCIAAAKTLACWVREKGLRPDYIVPTMEEWRVYVEVAVTVGMQAIKEGIAHYPLTREKLRRQAGRIIEDARAKVHALMRKGLVPLSPQMKTKNW